MREIGIGIVGGGYMGKAHAVAMTAVGAVFNTALRPRLVSVAAQSPASAERYARAYGFERAAADWQTLVADKAVEAVIVATFPDTHREISEAALALGKPVFCEKPLAPTLEDSRAMVDAAERAGVANMTGFNYVRTPATQFARHLVGTGEIGEITWFRGEHVEDYLADAETRANSRSDDPANGALGDVAPHILNAALALMGPVGALVAEVDSDHVPHPTRQGSEGVVNDDQVQIMCRFASGVMGQLHASRVHTGRKMGYAFEIVGTRGAIRFDQEDQNAIWLYRTDDPKGERGFRKILTGPAHPDYLPFCQGPGHGTGYQDQIIIEARDFLHAIETGTAVWPTFRDGMEVDRLIAAARASAKARAWVDLADI